MRIDKPCKRWGWCWGVTIDEVGALLFLGKYDILIVWK